MSCTCTDGTCTCHCGPCCPEPADVTINENTYIIGDGALALTYTALTGTTGSLAIQVQDDDGVDAAIQAWVELWFETGATATGIATANPFDTPGSGRIKRITNAAGLLTVPLEHNGAEQTLHARASLGGTAISSAVAITLGV